jgi:hypothetical protein
LVVRSPALFLSRYDAGDRTGVWDELHAIRDVAALEPYVRQDVENVAVATMRRAASNVGMLYRQLLERGYIFSDPEFARPWGEEGIMIRDLLATAAGPIPPVLAAWLSELHSVSFRGRPRPLEGIAAWKHAMLDPFEFGCDRESVEAQIENRRDGESLEFEFAGDTYHKNEISGGPPTCILLPSSSVDALVIESAEQSPEGAGGIWFVDYLRSYFDAGGFRKTRLSAPDAMDFVPTRVDDLLPI